MAFKRVSRTPAIASLLCAKPTSCARRSFFTLPDLSSLSPFPPSEPQTQTYHERKIFPYHAKQLYDVVSDVSSYPHFIPFCTGARILERSQQGDPQGSETMDAELTVGFLAFRESYVSKVTCTPFTSVEAVASSSTPLFKTLSTIWRFQPASPNSPHPTTGALPPPDQKATTDAMTGPTLVTLDLAFAFANPLHAAASAAFSGQVSKQMVKAFEERCLAVYGPGKQ
ncbi:hypothetical protein FIBSPDRAFT_811731 [Athelia psychrophila]|uniref:Coenzyme Q-binding protein COQ10 START domain-containing protein n=1 Tax=Athelia psychrophila TaxID=1759441 RepID=A0A166VNM0_9AGAM|nr:hypothetical protein FIBSPDRAFT_811731 [Fibularhizoctonia sp. CBS 109695]